MTSPWRDLLPTSVDVEGAEYEIRSDYRAVLDVFAALADKELDEQEKALALLDIFYPGFADMPPQSYREAIKKCFWFINCGEEEQERKPPKLVDWQQDFNLIAAPINRVMGAEIRSAEYMHWWTFVSAYMEIGDCLFAQIVRIREQRSRGKSLDKQDREFYRKNRTLVDFKARYSDAESDLLARWTGGN